MYYWPFCWICKSRLSIIKFANFVSIIIIMISWLFSEPTEKCNALNLFWQLFLRSVTFIEKCILLAKKDFKCLCRREISSSTACLFHLMVCTAYLKKENGKSLTPKVFKFQHARYILIKKWFCNPHDPHL